MHCSWVPRAQGLPKVALEVLARAAVASEGSSEGGSVFKLTHLLVAASVPHWLLAGNISSLTCGPLYKTAQSMASE